MHRKLGFWFAAVCLSLAAGAGGCRGGGGPSGEATSAVIVDVTPAAARDVPVVVSTVGSLEAINAASVRAEVAGRITQIVTDEGASVRAGQSLLHIDSERYRLKRESAAAGLAQALAQLENDSTLLARNEGLAESGAVDPQTLDDLRTRVDVDQASVKSARAVLDLATRDLVRSRGPAPFDGVFARRTADLGDYVAVGQELGEVVQARTLRLTFSLPETQAVHVSAGDPVQFQATALPGQVFDAEAYYVSPTVTQDTRTVTVKAHVSNPELRLKPGMSVDVRVATSVLGAAVVIPEVAVRRETGATYVFVASGGVAHRVDIETGPRPQPGLIVASTGVNAGDSLIVAGFQKISDGGAVEVRQLIPLGESRQPLEE